MKTIRRVQNVAIVIAMCTAIAIADGTEVTGKDVWSCFVMLSLVVVMIMYRVLNEERERGRSDEK